MNRRILKILALISMTIDHIGMILFPRVRILRIIGRISFPIFAYFIGEGYRYTSDKVKYVSLMAICEGVCLIGYFIVRREIYFSIMMTFIISVGIMRIYDYVKEAFTVNTFSGILAGLGMFVFLYAVNGICEKWDIMYGFWGCMLPFFIYIFKNKYIGLIFFGICLYIQSRTSSSVQIYALLSLIPLVFYDQKKVSSTKFEKYFYYVYYPVHIAVIYLIEMVW